MIIVTKRIQTSPRSFKTRKKAKGPKKRNQKRLYKIGELQIGEIEKYLYDIYMSSCKPVVTYCKLVVASNVQQLTIVICQGIELLGAQIPWELRLFSSTI
eukprot:TRINITY_DN43477_c0_g1_i1.p2 TRINITY_DN43477_c0_g1~~TRINITY_DN43477_c0_g1_i1.p2  ORF type:complete len:100 (+),score=8.42 TRINITY_DN43477_c0_g1_i1:447-746(+)